MPLDGSPRYVMLGAGGHARVVLESLQASGAGAPEGMLDADRSRWGTRVLGVPVLGGDALLPGLVQQGVTHFVMGLGGVGDNRPRAELFERALRHGLTPVRVTHPSAVCSPSAAIGAGSVLGPLAVVNAGAALGRDVLVNSGAIVEHDCVIADHVHVAPGARLSGDVQVGDGAHIGAGATVRQGLSIGAWAIVGAGAVVVKDVAAGVVVMGVPAMPRLAGVRR